MPRYKSVGKDFKKGDDPRRNTKGRPEIPPDIKVARTLTRIEFETIINQFVGMSLHELKEFAKDQSKSVMQHIVASIAIKAYVFGDQQRANYLTEQMFGKLPVKQELSGTVSLEQLVVGSTKGDE